MKKTVTILIGSGLALVMLAPMLKPVSADDNQIELTMIRHEAVDGDANSQLLYGLAYLEGRDKLTPDANKASYWLRRSARGGNAYAMLTLGSLYADGRGFEKDQKQAVRWWKKAAKKGNPRAQYLLGKSLLDGNGIDQDTQQAIDWLEKSARQGDSDAQYQLGNLLHEGNVVAHDDEAARNWLERAAAQAHRGAIKLLAAINNVAKSSMPLYPQSAEDLIEEAQQGNPQAEYELGLRYESGAWDVLQDNDKALMWITRAANSGNKTAMKTLADIYQNGDLGLAADPVKAVEWEKKASAASRMRSTQD